METAQHTTSKTQLKTMDESLTLRDILDIFLLHWKWFLLSVIVCVGAARLYLATKPSVYQRQAVMLVKEDGAGGRRSGMSTDALMQLNGVMMGTSVKNEVYILQSNQLMQEVVRKLHLDVSYSCKRGLQKVSLYDKKPFVVDFLDSFVDPVTFTVEMKDGKTARISQITVGKKELDYFKDVKVEEEINLPSGGGRICLHACPEYLEEFEETPVKVSRISLDMATNTYRGKVATGEMDKESTLIRLTCKDTNVQRADDILSTILSVYKQSIIEDKNQIARSTANFIEERIRLINADLDSVETHLAQFKKENQLVDLKQNSVLYLEQGKNAREKSIQLESQVKVAEYLLDYLKDKSKEKALIPSILGVSDQSIQNQINKYNELVLQHNRLEQNAGENSPAVADMARAIEFQKEAIVASMDGYVHSLNLQLQRAMQLEASVTGTISSVPEKERMALDIVRQQGIKEVLYTFLLNKREETALQLAITEANIRIVERPFGLLVPIAPRKTLIMGVALLLGFILPFAFFQIKAILNMGVRGRSDVEKYTTIPVLGEIPRMRESGRKEDGIVVSKYGNDSVTEAFRMLRFSLDFLKKGNGVCIMFTSTTPGEGKSFVSRNFAATLAMTGKRVVLVDADIRKRTQSIVLGRNKIDGGLTAYLSGSISDLNDLIVKDHSQDMVDFLPAGITPPNPAELLMSDRLELCIQELKKQYDYIIIDNVPAQVVADASIVNRVVDLTLYVIRVGGVDRRYLPELERLHQEGIFHDMFVVLNDVSVEHKYGYGRGYENVSSSQKGLRKLWKKS